ncbi:MAG: L,D-transpeptidase [Planctomycetota bacterium]|nr:L,D-transpeptidase [Planctomycetota bacterium]
MKTWMEILPVAGLAMLGCAAWFSARGCSRAEPPPASQPASAPAAANPLPPMAEPRVVVLKSQLSMTVYDGPSPVRTYRVAVGGGGGDKAREGDRCTPEGVFYICMKNEQSLYHLSLGLSYPNIEDAQRGLKDKLITRAQHDEIVRAIRNREQPPWNTPLGGEIMIHGCRNGRDTTLGCVAVENPEIEELFQALPPKTIVEIKP